jgi:hypothetical protein
MHQTGCGLVVKNLAVVLITIGLGMAFVFLLVGNIGYARAGLIIALIGVLFRLILRRSEIRGAWEAETMREAAFQAIRKAEEEGERVRPRAAIQKYMHIVEDQFAQTKLWKCEYCGAETPGHSFCRNCHQFRSNEISSAYYREVLEKAIAMAEVAGNQEAVQQGQGWLNEQKKFQSAIEVLKKKNGHGE